MKKFNIWPYIFIFITTFLILQYIQGGTSPDPVLDSAEIGIDVKKSEYAIGENIQVEVKNNTSETLVIEDQCPHPPFTVWQYTSEGYVEVVNEEERDCETTTDYEIAAGDKTTISLQDYSYSVFGEIGRYKLELTMNDGTVYSTPEFTITEPGLITKTWREVVYRPIFNGLIALLIYTPGHYLWLAIMLLTLFIRTLLLIPSQKAMRAQRNMQEIQPKLDELKKKFKDDQARLAQETMLIWKENKVSPLSSCLPMLVQFPILIALFYAIKWGLSPDRAHFIYTFLPTFSLAEINPAFFMFDLTKRSILVFPLVIGGLQFAQMQLMMYKKKKKKDGGKELSKDKPSVASEMESATSMMKYFMPIMIAFFTAQMPAAVGLYWGTSTFYGVIQQLVVNKEGSSPSPKKSNKDEVTVKVINKNHGKKD